MSKIEKVFSNISRKYPIVEPNFKHYLLDSDKNLDPNLESMLQNISDKKIRKLFFQLNSFLDKYRKKDFSEIIYDQYNNSFKMFYEKETKELSSILLELHNQIFSNISLSNSDKYENKIKQISSFFISDTKFLGLTHAVLSEKYGSDTFFSQVFNLSILKAANSIIYFYLDIQTLFDNNLLDYRSKSNSALKKLMDKDPGFFYSRMFIFDLFNKFSFSNFILDYTQSSMFLFLSQTNQLELALNPDIESFNFSSLSSGSNSLVSQLYEKNLLFERADPEVFKQINFIFSRFFNRKNVSEIINQFYNKYVSKIRNNETLTKGTNESILIKKNLKVFLDFILNNVFSKQFFLTTDANDIPLDILNLEDEKINGRTIEIGKNDRFLLNSVEFSLSDYNSIFNFAKIGMQVLPPSISDFTSKHFIASTDSNAIYVLPAIQFYNLRVLNFFLLFKLITHEIGHKIEGSFKFKTDDFNFEKIDLLPYEKAVHNKFNKEDIKKISEYVNQIFLSFSKKESIKLNSGNDINYAHFIKDLINTIKQTEVDEKFKDFKAILSKFLPAVINIYEDYKVDNAFLMKKIDDKHRFAYVGLDEFFELENLQTIYEASALSLLWKNHENLYLNNVNEKTEIRDATGYLLLQTKLQTLFDTFIKREPGLYELIEKRKHDLIHKENDKVIYNENINKTILYSLEFLALVFLKQTIKIKYIHKPNKSDSSNGTQGSSGETDGDQTQQANSSDQKEDESDDQENPSKYANDHPVDISETDRSKNKISKDNKDQGNTPQDNNSNSGNDPSLIHEKSKSNVNTQSIKISDFYFKFTEFFEKLNRKKIDITYFYDKKGVKADIKKLLKFLNQPTEDNENFFKNSDMYIKKGTQFSRRPIDIYIVLDISGSMTPERQKASLKFAFSMIAGYMAAIKKNPSLKKSIKLKLYGVASSNNILLEEYDLSNIVFNKLTKVIEHNVVIKGTGSTDLPQMLKKTAEKIIEEIESNEVKRLKGSKIIDSSKIIIFASDLGTTSSSNINPAFDEFLSFSKKLKDRTKIIASNKFSDIGVVFLTVAPDVDDKTVEAIINNRIEPPVYVLPEDEDYTAFIKSMESLIPILNGIGPVSNIKEGGE